MAQELCTYIMYRVLYQRKGLQIWFPLVPFFLEKRLGEMCERIGCGGSGCCPGNDAFFVWERCRFNCGGGVIRLHWIRCHLKTTLRSNVHWGYYKYLSSNTSQPYQVRYRHTGNHRGRSQAQNSPTEQNPTTWHETGIKPSLVFVIITIKEVAFDKLTISATVCLPFKYA